MVFDDTYPDFDKSRFQKCDWGDFYPEAAEAIPGNAPEPRGKGVVMTCFEDASHGSCMPTRQSQTGVLLYLNRAPIIWLSKQPNTVESSLFGSEFVAM
jgi:hypothetical protein